MQYELNNWPIALDQLRFDDIVISPSRSSSKFIFVGNTVGKRRCRGVIFKSSNGVIVLLAANDVLFNLNALPFSCRPISIPQKQVFSNILVMNNSTNRYGPGVWLGNSPVVSIFLFRSFGILGGEEGGGSISFPKATHMATKFRVAPAPLHLIIDSPPYCSSLVT